MCWVDGYYDAHLSVRDKGKFEGGRRQAALVVERSSTEAAAATACVALRARRQGGRGKATLKAERSSTEAAAGDAPQSGAGGGVRPADLVFSPTPAC
ncbi:hypothetical protein FXB39_06620 [Nocardioides sp. BGMRC 2183]|nr:hypothetical protein FXB39_06620 [Nocardioides sp. BGMRC 2183]